MTDKVLKGATRGAIIGAIVALLLGCEATGALVGPATGLVATDTYREFAEEVTGALDTIGDELERQELGGAALAGEIEDVVDAFEATSEESGDGAALLQLLLGGGGALVAGALGASKYQQARHAPPPKPAS